MSSDWGSVIFTVSVFVLMIRRPPRSTQSRSSAASDVYKRQPYAHVLEKTGGEQGLEGFVEQGRVVGVAGGETQVGADGLGLDPPIALDTDGLDGLGFRRKIAKARAKAQRERDATQHQEGCEQPSSQRPPHHFWCLPP